MNSTNTIEENRIYNEDCIDTMRRMPDNYVDLVVTSPPYNIGIDYDSYIDTLEWDDYFVWTRKWLQSAYRVLKEDGRIAVNHYISLGNAKRRVSPISVIEQIMCEIGYKHHSIVVWTDRTLAKRTAWGSWLSASAPYINSPFEGIIIDFKERWKKDRKGESDISKEEFISLTRGIWDIRTETRGLTKANFSTDFADKVIKLLTYKNDIVYDPFMGSGTVAVSCINNGRRYIGSEISEAYVNVAEDRIRWVVESSSK